MRHFASRTMAVVAVLRLPVVPLQTNGEWDEEKKEIRWSRPLPDAIGLPLMLRAVWVEPDAAWQTAHLGKVAIEDRGLADYARAHGRLTKDDAAKWDAFLEGLDGGSDVPERIQASDLGGDAKSILLTGVGLRPN